MILLKKEGPNFISLNRDCKLYIFMYINFMNVLYVEKCRCISK
jgi:hypothetical protein